MIAQAKLHKKEVLHMSLAFFDKNVFFCLLDPEIDHLTLKTDTMGQYFAIVTSKFVYQAP